MNLDTTIFISVTLIGSRDEYTKTLVELPHLNKTIEVKVPNFIDINSKLRLQGMGFVGPSGEKGDLYLQFNSINYSQAPVHENNSTRNTNTGAESRRPDDEDNSTSQRKTVYDGEIHKCPHCGETLKSFETVCPTCKQEIRGAKSTSAISALRNELKLATSDKQKIEIIKGFPVPNTKEDIFEFMFLASTNFDASYYATHLQEDDISDAWLIKIEQCYKKAKLVLKDESDLNEIQTIYNQIRHQIKKANNVHSAKTMGANLVHCIKSIGKLVVFILKAIGMLFYYIGIGFAKVANLVSKLFEIMPNPILAIVVLALLIFNLIRLFSRQFAGIDIIFDVVIIWLTYKFTVKKNDK